MKVIITFLTCASLFSSFTLTSSPLIKSISSSKDLKINQEQLNEIASKNNTFNPKFNNSDLSSSHTKVNAIQGNDFVHDLAKELNVTVAYDTYAIAGSIEKWLLQYQEAANAAFKKQVFYDGLGFDLKISDLPDGYCDFLNPINYINYQTKFSINHDWLKTVVFATADNMLKEGLNSLDSVVYNIDPNNVSDQNDLRDYGIWFHNYQNYIRNTQENIYKHVVNIATRGFATADEKDDTLMQLRKDDMLLHHLKKVVWDDTPYFLNNRFDYTSLILLDNLIHDSINWVNQSHPRINQLYTSYLNKAENSVDMYGYSLQQVLKQNPMPQTKNQIDDYRDGKSFATWLQSEVLNLYHQWQLTMGLSIGLPILFSIISVAAFFFIRYTNRYNPRDYRIYKRLEKIDQQRFHKKKSKKKKCFLK